jgi:uncharacterized protein YggE
MSGAGRMGPRKRRGEARGGWGPASDSGEARGGGVPNAAAALGCPRGPRDKTMTRFTLATVVLCVAAPGLSAQEPVQPAAAVVVTRGQATIVAMPDRAFVTIATESRSKNSAEAQRLNADAAAALLQKLQQAGIGLDARRTIAYDLPEVVRPMMRMAVAEAAASTPITPSTVEITAKVTLTAALR